MKVAAASDQKQVYAFGDFRLDPSKRLLFSANASEALALMPKAFDILFYLVENQGRVVEKDELMSALWPDTIVEENNLTQNISAIRRTLGEKHRENRYIATVPGRGYKFVANVSHVQQDPGEIRHQASSGVDRVPNISIPPTEGASSPRWFLATVGLLVLITLTTLGVWVWRENSIRSPGDIRTMAVLPFRPLVAEARDESLEMGMADTLISQLSGTDQLFIRPLAAVRNFNSLDQDSVDVGKSLRVDAVLDGSIQIAGDRVRVLAKLLRVSDGKQLWSGKFDEKLTDIFAVQDSISEKVAEALKIQLTVGSRRPPTKNVQAYQLYMKGNLHAQRLIMPEVQKGISYYEQAIAADPTYALAYVGIANAYRALVLTSDAPPGEMMPKAKSASIQAVELDPALAEAWTAQATSEFWFDYDWALAEKHYLKAIQLNPNNTSAHFLYAHLLSNIARHDEALAEIKRARELDPASFIINAVEGQILTFAGRTDEAQKVLEATIDMDHNFWLAHLFLSRVYLEKQMYDDALAAAATARDITHGNAEAMATVGFALARSGKADEARSVLTELETRSRSRFVPSYALAQIHFGLGDREKALELLEKAFADREALMVFIKVESKWAGLRNEPRFIELVKKMNFNQK